LITKRPALFRTGLFVKSQTSSFQIYFGISHARDPETG
jgi:hypothetical protein